MLNIKWWKVIAVAAALAVFGGCASQSGTVRTADFDALQNAIVADNVDYVRSMVTSGTVNVNQAIPAPAYPDGAPLITIAARAAALRVLSYLIAAGADLDAQTPVGETALMLASFFHEEGSSRDARELHDRAARMLVEAGASLENTPHNYTPLAYAAYHGHEPILRYLLERGARVDADAEGNQIFVNTPLMMAAIQGNRRAALWLLRAGANPRIRGYHGRTAVELAERNNRAEMVALLRCAERLQPGQPFARHCE